MDTKLKARWVKALTSGRYEQGDICLHYAGTYCCLGVLSKIGRFKKSETCFCNTTESGIDMATQRGLAKMNDDGVPFPVIAGFIRENL